MSVQLPVAIIVVVQEVLDTVSVDLDCRRNLIDEARRRCVEVNAEHAHRKLTVRLSVLDDRLCDDPHIIFAGYVKFIGGCCGYKGFYKLHRKRPFL